MRTGVERGGERRERDRECLWEVGVERGTPLDPNGATRSWGDTFALNVTKGGAETQKEEGERAKGRGSAWGSVVVGEKALARGLRSECITKFLLCCGGAQTDGRGEGKKGVVGKKVLRGEVEVSERGR